MPAAVAIRRQDYSAAELRRSAARTHDGDAARRMLALAHVMDGRSRGEAAMLCGMDRQTLRDWVHRFNQDGPDGLMNHVAPGAAPKLTAAQRAELAALVERGPIAAVDGVVRWRACDLVQWIYERFAVSVSAATM